MSTQPDPTSDSPHYTPDTLRTAELAIGLDGTDDSCDLCTRRGAACPAHAARAALDAVAPFIAAKALRDLADRIEGPSEYLRDVGTCLSIALDARIYADEIEAQWLRASPTLTPSDRPRIHYATTTPADPSSAAVQRLHDRLSRPAVIPPLDYIEWHGDDEPRDA